MAWKEVNIEDLAKDLGIDIKEAKEKQKLVKSIIKHRKAKRMSQAALAKKMGVSQARIAQIESGIGTSKITFDVLFSVLQALGCEYKIVIPKAA